MTRLKQLGKDSLIYGLGGIFSKSIGFFLLPVYTSIFSPQEYGTIEMLMVITALLSSVVGLGMDSAQSFYFFEQKEEGLDSQARVVSAILQWRLIFGGVVVVFSTAMSPWINSVFFNGQLGWEYFAVAFSGALFGQVMSQSTDVFRLLYRPWPYIFITLGQSIVAAILILYFILYFKQGLYGFFLGASVASLAAAVLGWVLIREYIDFSRIHTGWWKRLVRFGAPLAPAALGMYLMNTTDRWFIQKYHGAEELGVYAVGAKFAILIALVVETFRKAWWPIAMDAMHSKDGPETYRMVSRMFMGIGVAGIVYLTFLSPWMVAWMTPSSFHNASEIVGVLAFHSVFYGFFMVGAAGLWKKEKTYYVSILTLGAVALNFMLNYIMVPQWGGMGAALSTSLAFMIWGIVATYISECLWNVQFPVLILLTQVAIGIAVVGWLYAMRGGDHSWYIAAVVSHIVSIMLVLTAFDNKSKYEIRRWLTQR